MKIFILDDTNENKNERKEKMRRETSCKILISGNKNDRIVEY